MAEIGVDPGALAAEAERLRGDGATVFFVATDGRGHAAKAAFGQGAKALCSQANRSGWEDTS
jgi:hypothetical protein